MRTDHGFDYHHTCRQLNLDYYGQVKVINYIRRQVLSITYSLILGNLGVVRVSLPSTKLESVY